MHIHILRQKRKGEKEKERGGGGQEISKLHEKLWHILNIFMYQNNMLI